MVQRSGTVPESPGGGPANGGPSRRDEEHLVQFAASRQGVEAYVEPRPAVTETTSVPPPPDGADRAGPDLRHGRRNSVDRIADATVLLVAADGEWIRRRVASPQAAHQLAYRLGIPAHDPSVVGYPARMRAWSAGRYAGPAT
jgi:hypothetical protein